jgi:hypothetical protein
MTQKIAPKAPVPLSQDLTNLTTNKAKYAKPSATKPLISSTRGISPGLQSKTNELAGKAKGNSVDLKG